MRIRDGLFSPMHISCFLATRAGSESSGMGKRGDNGKKGDEHARPETKISERNANVT